MPKTITFDDLAQPAEVPQAAGKTPTKGKGAEIMPFQIRIPRGEVKRIKRAAVDEEKTLSDFMLNCFHVYMQTSKKAQGV